MAEFICEHINKNQTLLPSLPNEMLDKRITCINVLVQLFVSWRQVCKPQYASRRDIV